MDIIEFIQLGSVILFASIAIYAYAQRFLTDIDTERGFHWRGMLLKYATIPAFLYAFALTLVKKRIPYIPTPKTAARNFMNPFVIPLITYVVVFILTVIGVYINRRYFVPESELLFTRQQTWGMLGFSFTVFIQAIFGLWIAYSAVRLKPENAWSRIKIKKDKSIEIIDS